jgi:hypothetical protein
MAEKISRRDFLKLAAISTGSLGIFTAAHFPKEEQMGIARITVSWIGLYPEPTFRTRRLTEFHRDDLIPLFNRITSDDGPSYNPIWYQVADGYIHSGHVQLVQWHLQTPHRLLPEEGALFEITVPYTRSRSLPDPESRPFYRLYYQSTAWVNGVEFDLEGRAWYRIHDDTLRVSYYARAEHLKWIPPEQLSPISAEVPLHAKRIEVLLADQELRAYEYDRLVMRTRISSGIPNLEPQENDIPTVTPTGHFYIDKKMPVKHMGDGHLTSDLEAYELPGVPWVAFFHETGVAFHGTYWHNDFGRPKSHGCINMRNGDAKWLYRWSLPTVAPNEVLRIGRGTSVIVI